MAPAFAPALALLAAAAVLRPAAGRVVTGSTVLTGEVTEQELCKFAYRVGRGSFKLWAWVEAGARYQSRELTAYAYLDGMAADPRSAGPAPPRFNALCASSPEFAARIKAHARSS